MTQDRTAPMQQPQWSRRDVNLDDQPTVYADQESATPPTMPLGDQVGAGREQPPGPAFAPAEREAPTPYPPPPAWGGQPQPEGAAGRTMIIGERPSPTFAWLVVVDGPDRGSVGQVHTLHPDTTAIGRVAGNHIVVHDPTCSAQHARVRVETDRESGERKFVLYDMGSRNGTFIGDRESYKEEENQRYRHELQDGDYLLVGETTLVFKTL